MYIHICIYAYISPISKRNRMSVTKWEGERERDRQAYRERVRETANRTMSFVNAMSNDYKKNQCPIDKSKSEGVSFIFCRHVIVR